MNFQQNLYNGSSYKVKRAYSSSSRVPLKEELRMQVCKNRVLRKISGSRKDEVTGDRRRLHIVRSFMICTPHQILIR
jgi:hypothetical protein